MRFLRRGVLTCSNSSSPGLDLSFLLSSTAVWNAADDMIARLADD